MIKKLILPLITLYTLTHAITDVWKADVSVDKVTKTINDLNYTCLAVISNNGDDDARNTKAIILLPMNTKFIEANVKNIALDEYKNDVNKTDHVKDDVKKTNCIESKSNETYLKENAYIECSLGDLSTLANISIEIKSEFIDANRTSTDSCSAFVFSISPDGDLGDNYGESK